MATENLEATLAANLGGDRFGLPDWYTHFGSPPFAESAIPAFSRLIEEVYPNREVDIVGFGSGIALYERVVAAALVNRGWRVSLVVSDLQQTMLDEIPRCGSFPIRKINADARSLPLEDGIHSSTPRLLLSRAIEHYLPAGGVEELLAEAARLLRPGHLYVAQLSSGDRMALTHFEHLLDVLAGKRIDYLSVSDYRNILGCVMGKNGEVLFEEVRFSEAQNQPRSTLEQARRYLNSTFLNLHGEQLSHSLRQEYESGIAELVAKRDRLGVAVWHDEIPRDHALEQLDLAIKQTTAFSWFREILAASARQSLSRNGLIDENEFRIEDDGDVIINVRYPIFVLRRTGAAYLQN